MSEFLRTCGNPGRGAHYFALEGARKIFDARENIADFLGVKQSERLIFTGGCTTSINMVIKGLAAAGDLNAGDSVIVSTLEHNSVMRPLEQLRETLGIKIVDCVVDENFEPHLRALVEKHSAKLVALTWAGNVTGEVLPIQSVARYLEQRQIPLLVDGAQTAGKIKADLAENVGISFYCASGHKGLMGPPGVGLLYVSPKYSLVPLIAGGTGSRSEQLEMPLAFPDRLEAGTLPGPAIAALSAGVDWLRKNDPEKILNDELALKDRFLSFADNLGELTVYGHQPGTRSMPTVSFSMSKLSPSSVADKLDTEYGIAVRSGLHCSAATHQSMGTVKNGLVRVSFGPFNKQEEVDVLCSALQKIASQSC